MMAATLPLMQGRIRVVTWTSVPISAQFRVTLTTVLCEESDQAAAAFDVDRIEDVPLDSP